MNNADATWIFRHVPSINSACKFQLTGSLHSTYGNKVETWKFKATESADRIQTILYWLMACGNWF